MEYVETRNAEKLRKERLVRKLRKVLEQGDRVRIAQMAGLSEDTVYKTLKKKPTILSNKVLEAGVALIEQRTGKPFKR